MRRSVAFCSVLLLLVSALAYCDGGMVRPGTTRHALTLPDGAAVSLDAVAVAMVIAPYFFVRDPWKDAPMLPVYGNAPVSRWSTIDLTGTMTTIAGHRVIIAEQASVYTDSKGRTIPLFLKGYLQPYNWLHKLDIPVPAPSETIPTPPSPSLPPAQLTEPISAPAGTIADVKLSDEAASRTLDSTPQIDGSVADFTGKVVTAVLLEPGTGKIASFYVQEPITGGNGIRVIPSQICSLVAGDVVHIAGSVVESSDSMAECYVSAQTVVLTGSAAVPAPVGLSQKMATSGAFGRQHALYAGNTLKGAGLSAVGTRVRVWGRVTWKSADGSTCFLNDGSGLTSTYSGQERAGMRVVWPAGRAAAYQIGDFVAGITGVLGAELSQDATARAVPVLRIPNNILTVRQTLPPSMTATTWLTAYHSIQEAIAAADSGDQVWVAQGTYYESITLKAGVPLYGGFPINSAAARDPRIYTSTISAAPLTSAVTAIGEPTATKLIDGFYITNGSGTEINSQRLGGGIYCLNAKLVAANNTISRNGATGTLPVLGGGIYVGASADVTLSSSRIEENGSSVADSNGAGIYCASSTLLAASNLVCANKISATGSSVYCSGSTGQITLTNNTISGTHGYAGIYCDNASPGIANNIIASSTCGVYNSGTGVPTLSYNCLFDNTNDYFGVPAGASDISSDPLFKSSVYGDYHIKPGSPCVDAGDDSAVAANWTDLDSNPRIDHDHVDIGADEALAPRAAAPAAPIVTAQEYTNLNDSLSATVEIDPAADVTGYRFAIGTTDTDPGSGYFCDWELTASNALQVDGLTLTEGKTYYFYVQAKNHDGLWSGVGLSSGITVDLTAPVSGTPSVAENTSSTPISVNYADAFDDLSGISKIELWYQKDGAEWTNSGLTSIGESGVFYFQATDGVYNFSLVGEDCAGNRSPSIDNESIPNNPAPASTTFSQSTTIGGRAKSKVEYLYPGGPVLKAEAYDENSVLASWVGYNYGKEGELLSLSGDADKASVQYDALYRVKKIIDGLGHVSQSVYDMSGTLNAAAYPPHNGQIDVSSFTSYDSAGKLLASSDPNAKTWGYSYELDKDGLLTEVDYPGADSPDITFVYSEYLGELMSVTQAGVMQKSYTYDDLGALSTVTTKYDDIRVNNEPVAFVISYSYWSDGSLQKMTLPNGHYYWYEYDTAGRISIMSRFEPGANKMESVEWTYPTAGSGFVGTQTVRNGSGALISKTTYTCDRRGMLMRLLNENANGVLSDFQGASGRITYDALGNIDGINNLIPNKSSLSGAVSYTYNNLSQLTREDSERGAGYDTTFAYDDATNAITFEGAFKTFNECNQSNGSTYDSNGNPTTYNGTSLTFDVDNQMTAYGNVMTAGYGVDGSRIWKKVGSNAKRYFLYAGGVPVCEMSDSGTIVAINSFGPSGLISRHEGESHYFYTFDPLGHVCQIQNASGTVTTSAGYTAYGTPLAASEANPTPFGYGGQVGYYTDNETSLILCSARYYDPSQGRWLTRDPIGYDGGLNVYAYCGGNPIGRLDPSGLEAVGDAGFWEGLIPIWGSGRAAVNDFQNCDYASAIGNTALAVSDVFVVKSVFSAGAKLGIKGVAKVNASLAARAAKTARAAKAAKSVVRAAEESVAATSWTRQEMMAYGRRMHSEAAAAWRKEGWICDRAGIPGSRLRTDGMESTKKLIRELKPNTESGMNDMRRAERKYMDAIEKAYGKDHGWIFQPQYYNAPWK